MATTRDEVFAATADHILRAQGAKARGLFRNHWGCLTPEALQQIDDMCTNNSLTSMVSWLLSQSFNWFTVYEGKRYVTLSSYNDNDLAYVKNLRYYHQHDCSRYFSDGGQPRFNDD